MLDNVVTNSVHEPLSKTVLDEIGQNIFRCYQCVKCTSGCPLADQFDLTPNQVMRSLQLNDPSVLESKAIWLCASCQTCASRCPQEIDVTSVMDLLRIEAIKRGIKPAIPDVQKFHWVFMKFIKHLGRVPELLFVLVFKVLRGKPFADMGIGLRMLKKGKLKPWPHFARTPRKVTPLDEPENKVAYFPGCSASSSAKEYDLTVRSTADILDIKLVEPPGWVCCGSSSAHATDSTLASVYPLRTMSTIERMCPMCHMNLDARQPDMATKFDMPIFHSTQLTALAFGLDVKKSHFNKNIVDPMPLLRSKELV
jgi:heterodisulfide reductase subunit B